MCGIVGYIGGKKASDYLISGLHRLEYRGYDSAGIVTLGESGANLLRAKGKVVEQILQDLSLADKSMEITILRYFNPIGADKSGLIGESPNGIPNNLLPYIAQVATGKLPFVNIFGDDYDTPDGTGVRDYIHVVDLAKGHLAALEHIKPGISIYNLGTGRGTSVLGLVKAFSKVTKREIPYKIVPRRAGDIAKCYASSEKAKQELGWQSERTIEDACADSWRWQSQNPNGF